ncbi:MAG: hypothetical protein ACLFUR_01835 [Candidatus Hadarchaeia archaeon]
MARDPFDEFRKIEKMFKKMMSGDFSNRASSSSISVRRIGDKTEVTVRGDISRDEIEGIKRKYPDAEINVDGEIEESKPVEVLDKDDEKEEAPDIREVDEEEMDPQELALKRYQEREMEKED